MIMLLWTTELQHSCSDFWETKSFRLTDKSWDASIKEFTLEKYGKMAIGFFRNFITCQEYVVFEFDDPDEAMLFKLKWM